MTIGVAACSGEVSRFSEGQYAPRGNPKQPGRFRRCKPRRPAGWKAIRSRRDAPRRPVRHERPRQQRRHRGRRQGLASYSPTSTRPEHAWPSLSPARPSAALADVTGSVSGPKPRAPTGAGTAVPPITVAPGDTIDTIARRYGVPASAIIQSNNLTEPATIHAGQQLVIPRYSNSSVAARPPRVRPLRHWAPQACHGRPASPAGNPGVHVVAQGETLSKISRLYSKPVNEIAKANNIQLTSPLKIGDRLVIPGARVSAAKSNATPIKSTPAVAQPKPCGDGAERARAAQSASMVTPVAEYAARQRRREVGGRNRLAAEVPLAGQWPRDRAFGPTTNGQQNDGINIALPENTPVKAAEDGVVAYAGNELKGYGNLVLVRHPNGYVTAYAHAKELLVKRGDQVKRGQPIARSGQTGNVNAPQLHFEIRKGASPLDPIKFLNGA